MTTAAFEGSHCVTQPSSHAFGFIIEAQGEILDSREWRRSAQKRFVQVGICMYRSEASKVGRPIPSEYAHRMRRAGALRAQWQQR